MDHNHHMALSRRACILRGIAATGLVVGGLAGPSHILYAADPITLTLYSAQHHQMVDILTQSFTKETGIKVRVH